MKITGSLFFFRQLAQIHVVMFDQQPTGQEQSKHFHARLDSLVHWDKTSSRRKFRSVWLRAVEHSPPAAICFQASIIKKENSLFSLSFIHPFAHHVTRCLLLSQWFFLMTLFTDKGICYVRDAFRCDLLSSSIHSVYSSPAVDLLRRVDTLSILYLWWEKEKLSLF